MHETSSFLIGFVAGLCGPYLWSFIRGRTTSGTDSKRIEDNQREAANTVRDLREREQREAETITDLKRDNERAGELIQEAEKILHR